VYWSGLCARRVTNGRERERVLGRARRLCMGGVRLKTPGRAWIRKIDGQDQMIGYLFASTIRAVGVRSKGGD
jgi:hypothetical protein